MSRPLHTRTIRLVSGGTVTLHFHGNPYEMSLDDREFVFLLADRLSEYERDAKDVSEGKDPQLLAATATKGGE